MSADERTFTARFGTGDWMTGIRVVDDNEFLGQQVDRSIPAMTLYNFLSIMNAVGPGRMELQSEAKFGPHPTKLLDASVSVQQLGLCTPKSHAKCTQLRPAAFAR